MTCHSKSGADCETGTETAAWHLLGMTRPLLAFLASSCATIAMPAAAQDAQTSGRNVVIGAGIEVVPKYPGASSGRIDVLPLFDTKGYQHVCIASSTGVFPFGAYVGTTLAQRCSVDSS